MSTTRKVKRIKANIVQATAGTLWNVFVVPSPGGAGLHLLLALPSIPSPYQAAQNVASVLRRATPEVQSTSSKGKRVTREGQDSRSPPGRKTGLVTWVT